MQAESQLITIGDKIPDYKFSVSGKQISLSSFKKKLIILDFWSQKCTSCILSFKRMDSLQKRFNSEIQIILVNRESAQSTSDFFIKHSKLTKPDLIFISGDTLLNRLFQHSGEPYHVWIDSTLAVAYKTDAVTTSEKNIERYLHGDRFKARYVTYTKNYVSSLFDSSRVSDIEYFSYLSHCRMGYHINSFNKDGCASLTQSSVSIEELYQVAYNESEQSHYGFKRPGRTILTTKDSLKIKRPADPNLYSEWYDRYCYNYQLLIPQGDDEDKYRILKEDLQRNFKFKASVELRNLHCLVLVHTSTNNKLSTRGGKPLYNFYRVDETSTKIDPVRQLVNVPYSAFSDILCRYIEDAHQIPFVDATGLIGNVDIGLSGKAMDSLSIPVLNAELKNYDLDLVEMDLPIAVLVIDDY